MSTEHVPVVIIGAGPTGTSAAIMLGQRGIRCLVLERWPEVYPLPRAVHFDDEVCRIFASMGLEDEVRALSRPAPGMQLTDAHQRVLAEFHRDPARQVHGYPQANMFDQPELERVLRATVGRYAGVELRTGVEVFAIDQTPGGVRIRYREVATGTEHEIRAEAALGCDGANSITRAVVGATMEDFRFEQRWLVVDVESPEPLHVYDGVQQVCCPDRAATFMPVVPGRYRWEFRLRAGEQPRDFDESRVRQLISPWLTGVDADKLTFLRQTCYTFRGLVADRWRNGRVFLLGDAAHQTPPFIGQGMCAGIRDADNLAWKLALVLTGNATDALLDTYEAERRPYARRVIQLAIAVGWLMTGGTTRTAPARRTALRLLTQLPGAEDRVLNATWPAFGDGPLSRRSRRRSAAGTLCAQPAVRSTTGSVRLDNLLGRGFAIVHRGPDRASVFDPATRAFFEAIGTTVVRVDEVEDFDGALDALLDNCRADALLIRPDRIIAAVADAPDLRGWQRELRSAGIDPVAKG
jgi:3-(3-hydroxy-phenyl)propionate hydroxylase